MEKIRDLESRPNGIQRWTEHKGRRKVVDGLWVLCLATGLVVSHSRGEEEQV